jgi:hypothetical protein
MLDEGNGAREALRNLFAEHGLVAVKDYESATDLFLAELWIRGFKIVPLEESDKC